MKISNMGMIPDGDGALTTAKCFPARWNTASQSCEFCKSAAALLFCRSDSTFTCLSCDAKMHAPLKHERVWLCDVCEQAPAAVTCKADSAALCYTCDRDIHSANPLARRHERAPVVPFYGTAESIATKSTAAAAFPVALQSDNDRKLVDCITNDNYISDPWISKLPADIKSLELLFSDSDRFLDFDSYQISAQLYSDSVVPIQTTAAPPPAADQLSHHEHSPENRFEIDFTRSNINSYSNSYSTQSLSNTVSSSSIDVGVVPDGSTISDTSFHFTKTFNSSADLIGNLGNSQVTAMDRKARVLRYKEKRNNRKFQKTIRYASRKAYAETRPRMKGRFVKRTDSELDIAGIFSSGEANFVADARYGVVPSFR